MSRVALLLPIGPDPFASEQMGWLSELDGCGLESVWVRDLPLVNESDGDLGSGYDPFVHLGFIAQLMTQPKLGTAVLGTAFRDPLITAKAAASLQAISGNRFLLGIGPGEKRSLPIGSVGEGGHRHEPFVGALSALDEVLRVRKGKHLPTRMPPGTSMALGPCFTPPPFHIASSSETIWRAVGGKAEGWMTWFQAPRQFAETRKRVLSCVPREQPLQTTMTVSVVLSKEPDAAPRSTRSNGFAAIEVGERSLRTMLAAYSNLGVDRFLLKFPGPRDPVAEVKKVVTTCANVLGAVADEPPVPDTT
jgi:alkanesulfonate monooxygenase SsuD/methylene tetrahydromethanopterin reductase-like flavin-dependent oxidoreductase (luciferase family)